MKVFELATMPVEKLENLNTVLSVIDKNSFLGAVVSAYPDFLPTALISVSADEPEALKRELWLVAAGHVLGGVV